MVSKDEARRRVYQRLRDASVARFPVPIEGRIPNFTGAEAAATHLRQIDAYQRAKVVKVGPDSPLLAARAGVLADGKLLLMPAPRLTSGFLLLRPERVPTSQIRKAVSLKHCDAYGESVALADLPQVDFVVAGSVAVQRSGARAGKGEGYSDIEYALLRELGQPEMPVATIVHPLQMMKDDEGFATDPHDLPLDYIVTPSDVIETNTRLPKPTGIDWAQVSDERMATMPVLQELRHAQWERLTVRDLIRPGLRVLFVGLNPGRWTATKAHHFAGPGNHFWRLLFDAGFTPSRFAPEEDANLLDLGYGVTNIVSRATRGEEGLTWSELQAGGETLRAQVANVKPKVVALLGKQVYRAYAGLTRSAAFPWGLQERESVPGVREFAAPNPSARSTIPYEARLALFQELRALADGGNDVP